MFRRALGLFLTFMLLTSTVVSAHAGLTGATNQYRANHGLTTLASNGTLDAMAEQRAREIVSNFNHSYWWADRACWQGSGENLAFTHDSMITKAGYSGPVEYFVFNQWHNSPAHRANMLGDFNEVGTAVYSPGNGYHYAVQLFIKSCGGSTGNTEDTSTSASAQSSQPQAPQPQPAPTSAPAGTPDSQPAAITPVTLPDTAMER